MKSNGPSDPESDFAGALRTARSALGRSQEDFDIVSSRTYISNLERGLKIPTIKKVDSLATVLGIHPLTLLALSYLDTRKATEADLRALLTMVFDETSGLLKEASASR